MVQNFKKFCAGIDLGTTNSVISLAEVRANGQIFANPVSIERITNSGIGIEGKINYTKERSNTLPSCVYYSGDKVIVGDYAREQYKKYPDRVAKSIKSQMGNQRTRDLGPDVFDKTPEEISARILSHLKKYTEQMYRRQIDDVIITVPANFDAARREATMIAAEKAGFNVRDTDGKWKQILISEPNAVLYNLVQKILNGELMESILDFSTKKRVLVFDIGGGTLDVTFHEIERDADNRVTLNISEIAASRFTQLAGDDFDKAIAECLYDRCIEKFRANDPGAVKKLKERSQMVKKMLAVAAEQLKMNINAEVDGFGTEDDWFGGYSESDGEVEYTITQSIGDERIYNDTVTKSEFEAMLERFMGKKYTFSDYKGYSTNSSIDRNNIISPILDVLEKAARYYELHGDEVTVDAVILNGGMSKLYIIKERIEEFFGLEPIVISDPDLSVANGAAVYGILKDVYQLKNTGIAIKRHVQNDDLYLGLATGANDILISVGDELPHSKVISGYRLAPNTNTIEIPIKRGEENGEPRTIARGIIVFQKPYSNLVELKIDAEFDQTGLLTIKASIFNKSGVQLETAKVEIALGDTMERSCGGRIIPASGTILMPANEINSLENLFSRRNKSKNKIAQADVKLSTILNCGNPEDFEEYVLRYLETSDNITLKKYLYSIAGKFACKWSQDGVRTLKKMCTRDVSTASAALQPTKNQIDFSNHVMEVIRKIGW